MSETDTPTNDVTALRGLLFDTLRDLRDKEKPMDVDRARAISDVAKVLVDSAKVEVEHLKLTGGDGSGFIPEQSKPVNGTPAPNAPRLVKGRDMKG